MKRAFYVAVTMLLLASLNATANAQITQDPSSAAREVWEERVKVEYDRFADSTSVMMLPLFLSDQNELERDPYTRLRLLVSFSSPGDKVTMPSTTTFLFVVDSVEDLTKKQPFETVKSVYLLIDGASHPLGVVLLAKTDVTKFPMIRRTYVLEVPFKLVEMIGSGKSVEMRAGSVESTLDENIKMSFRRLVDVVSKKGSSATFVPVPKPKEKTIPREVKRPEPARTSRKRGRP